MLVFETLKNKKSRTVCLIETVRKTSKVQYLLIETKRKICNSTFNRTVCLIESTE